MNPATILQLWTTQTWQVTSLGVVAWGVHRWLAKDKPHLAHALWALVLLKCITPPVISSPVSPFCWLSSPSEGSATSTVSPRQPAEPASKTDALEPLWVRFDDVSAAGPMPRAAETSAAEGSKTLENRGVDHRFDWSATWLFAWLAMAATWCGLTICRLALFQRGIASATREPDAKLLQTARMLQRKLHLRRPVRLRLVDSHIGPAVVGLLRPTILLPQAIVEGRTAREIEPLVAHEMIHIRRGDLWWALLQTLATSLWWFNPLVWLASRKLTVESERSCDEETISSLGYQPAAYARILLDVLERKHLLRVAPALPGVRPVDVTAQRLERIMRLGQGSYQRSPWWIAVLMLLGGALVLPGATSVIGQDGGSQDTPAAVRPQPARPLPILPNPTTQSSEELPQSFALEHFDVGDLLSQLIESGVAPDQAPPALVAYLPQRSPKAEGSTTPQGVSVEFLLDDHQPLKLGDSEPTMKIVDQTLYAFESQLQRDRIRETLKERREFGFQQVQVEIQIVSAPQETIQKIRAGWKASSDTNATVGSDSEVVTLDAQDFLSAQAFKQFSRPTTEQNVTRSAFEAADSNHPDADSGVDLASNEVEMAAPAIPEARGAFHQIFTTPEETSLYLRTILASPEATLISAPKIAVFNGQRAEIFVGQQHPFVVGKRLEQPTPGPSTVARQPVIHQIDEGLRVEVTPVLHENGHAVNLTCSVEMTEIVEGQTNQLQGVPTPTVARQQLDAQICYPLGSTFVFHARDPEQDEDTPTMLAFLTCQNISLLKTHQLGAAAPAHKDNEVAREASAPDKLATPEPSASQSKAETPQTAPDVLTFRNSQFSLSVQGRLRTHVDRGEIQVEGAPLEIDLKRGDDSTVRIRCEQGRLEAAGNSERWQGRFAGDVQARLGELTISAKELQVSEQTFAFQGNVRIGKDGLLGTSDRLVGQIDSGILRMMGNVSIRMEPEEGGPLEMQAQRIDWNLDTEEIQSFSK